MPLVSIAERADPEQHTSQRLVRPFQIGVCALVAFAVIAFGAIDPVAEFALETGSLALFLCWFILGIRQRRIKVCSNWLYASFLGLCGVALAQYTLGLTAYPYATKVELLKLGTYLLVGFLATQSFQTERDIKSLAWFLMALGFVVSLFGIVQFFTWNGEIFWIRKVADMGTAFGPFVNRDHFAGFVELTFPFAVALLLSGVVSRDLLALAVLFGALQAGAVFLSASRGGILSLVFELVVLAMLQHKQIGAYKNLRRVAVLLALCGAVIAWLGMEGPSERFRELASSGVSRDRRVSMYTDTWRIFQDHPWMGTGLGTLEFVYSRYESYYDGSSVNHTHNDYLELLADTGIAGGACGMAFLVVLFRKSFSNALHAANPASGAFCCGGLAASAGFLLHSLVDFNLHITSNALLFFLIAFTTSASIRFTKAKSA